MDHKPNFFTDTKLALEQYVQDRMLLIKLEAIEKLSKLVSSIFEGIVLAVLGFFIILFLSIMAGFYFAALLKSNYWGFGIVAGIYIVLFILIIVLRKKVIEKFVGSAILKTFFDQTDKHHEHAGS